MRSTQFFSMALILAVTFQMTGSFAQANSKAKAKAQVLTLDVGASKAVWLGKKVKGEHTGTVAFKEGKFEVKKNNIVGGEVVIDLTSINNTDLTDADYKKKLEGHLKSEDFFDIAKFPTATFVIKSFREVHPFAPGGPNAKVKGKLTIRGVTKPAEMDLVYTAKEGAFEAKGKLEIDRTQFGVKYNSKKFFSAASLGDKLINDKFEVTLEIVANQGASEKKL